MSSPSLQEDILTAEELQCLEEDEIILPHSQDSSKAGTRKVELSLLKSGPMRSTQPSSPSATSFRNFQPRRIYRDLPIVEKSPAVLEYLGFESATAREIFDRYAGRSDPDECPDTLLDYACGQISALTSPPYVGLDGYNAMRRVGLKEELATAIANPEFADLLGTADLHFWVKVTMVTNLATLESWQNRPKRHTRRRIAEKAQQETR